MKSEESDVLRCKCVNWARTCGVLWNHHTRCPKFDAEAEVAEILKPLLRGIESWAWYEDGIHEDVWDAYRRAKVFVGELEVLKGEER